MVWAPATSMSSSHAVLAADREVGARLLAECRGRSSVSVSAVSVVSERTPSCAAVVPPFSPMRKVRRRSAGERIAMRSPAGSISASTLAPEPLMSVEQILDGLSPRVKLIE